ncbi:hypothetical protein ABI59_20505 [Acidobacteria bacterium Mor1]|nr:hypothetical protein ABI59_20505 [Acidobacteria bacterium Mor1]
MILELLLSSGMLLAEPTATGATRPGANPLGLGEVLGSVERHYPGLLAAEELREIAAGKLQAGRGRFDTELRAGYEDRSGFYDNLQASLGVRQPLRRLGGDIEAAYRLGRDSFADYDGDLLTNRDGEWSVDARLPLARDLRIDDRRVALESAEIEVERVTPRIREARISARRLAERAYWEWLSAGQKYRIAEDVLELAENRQSALEASVEEGLIAGILLVDNERLIAERTASLISAERGLQDAAIDLSVFYRDSEGNPRVVDAGRLPADFPPLDAPAVRLDGDIANARDSRPEPQLLRQKRRQLELEARGARNKLQPKIDLKLNVSQDVGDIVSNPDDKSELAVKAGIAFGLPIQRREAAGKLREREGELRRIDQQIRLLEDRIEAQVREAHNAWTQAFRRYEQASRSLDLARELEDAERIQVQEGNSDLLRLNIREQQSAQAAVFLVDAMTEYYEARNDYRAALGTL